jgi:hypothetical protein
LFKSDPVYGKVCMAGFDLAALIELRKLRPSDLESSALNFTMLDRFGDQLSIFEKAVDTGLLIRTAPALDWLLHEGSQVGSDYETKKEEALYLSKYDQYRDLAQPDWQQIITAAAVRNDHEFFKRLGRKLVSNPKEVPEEGGDLKLPRFLLEHWDVRAEGLPELFYLSFPDLLKVCQCRLDGYKSNSPQWMEKVCLRMGLKPLRRRMKAEARLRLKDLNGEPRFRRPDGWLYP